MALWNRDQTPTDAEMTDLGTPAPSVYPAHPPLAPHPDVPAVAPVLPVRTPGAAPAISESTITGSAFTPHDVPAVPFEHVDDQTRAQQAQPISDLLADLSASAPTPDLAFQPPVDTLDEHPLTSTDLAYRYSKEKASGVEAGLRHLRARRALSEMSDTDLGLVTVSATSLYDLLCADLGFTPGR